MAPDTAPAGDQDRITTTAAELMRKMRNKHLEDNPDCPYGDQPHFVPPSFGQVGFYACNPPKDVTNHTRCRPPYEHEHSDHRPEVSD